MDGFGVFGGITRRIHAASPCGQPAAVQFRSWRGVVYGYTVYGPKDGNCRTSGFKPSPPNRPIKNPPKRGGLFIGAPGGIRTPDHLVRSQVLYPAELQAHNSVKFLLTPRSYRSALYYSPHPWGSPLRGCLWQFSFIPDETVSWATGA